MKWPAVVKFCIIMGMVTMVTIRAVARDLAGLVLLDHFSESGELQRI